MKFNYGMAQTTKWLQPTLDYNYDEWHVEYIGLFGPVS